MRHLNCSGLTPCTVTNVLSSADVALPFTHANKLLYTRMDIRVVTWWLCAWILGEADRALQERLVSGVTSSQF